MNQKILCSVFLIGLLPLILFSGCDWNNKDKNTPIILNDSISSLIKNSKNNQLSLSHRDSLLQKAYLDCSNLKNDSLKVPFLSSIAYQFYVVKNVKSFEKVNKETLSLAKKLKDSFYIADAHWSYGEYYIDVELYDKAYHHYNSGYKYFSAIKKEYETARMLYSLSFIKARYRDYNGSEVLTFEAIKKFKELENYKYLYFSYNRLALIQNDIKDFEKGLMYNDKALEYLSKMSNKQNYYSWTLNNIGLNHLLNKRFDQAIIFFDKALKHNSPSDLKNYAIIIDNRAYARLKLNDTTNVKKELFESLRLRDSLNVKAGIIASKIRISDFYEYLKDTTNAIKYIEEANKLAKEIKNGGDYLTTLKQLADLKPKKSKYYLNEHIRFNDSLIDTERKTLNKFTRIEFETDEVEQTNKVLTKQRIWIFACSIGAILILSLLYLVRVQRAKNEKLFLETEQQKANEQVYLLTLKQQSTLEEEKTRERNRISQELHDGILGRLFGTRVGMGFLDIGSDEETQKQHQAFLDELQEIEKEIREVSHKLNTNFEDSDVNFTTIINQLLESKSQIGDFRFHLDIDQNISWKSTDEIIKVNVYRIIQEALQNTIKHANAQNVTLDFSSDSSQLTIRLKDDGKGFSMKKSKKGIGLKNIRSRVQKMNGTIDIVSAIGKGTEIHIKIPISQ